MKKLIALIMSIIIVFASTLFTIASSSVKGDTNGDGVITSADALEILRFCVSIINDIDKTAADVNSDGKINSADALEVLKIVVGLVNPTAKCAIPNIIGEDYSSASSILRVVYGFKNIEIVPVDYKGDKYGYNQIVSVVPAVGTEISLNDKITVFYNENGPESSSSGSSSGDSGAKDPISYSATEVVNYYNKCLKDSYAKKVTVKKTETINIKVDDASGGDVFKNFFSNIILPKYAGTKTYEKTFVGGKSGDESLEGYASPTGLAAGDAASAKITKNGSNYEITIKTKAESSTLEKAPRINKSCSHPLDLASVDIAPAKVTKADFSYPGTTLTATVDATGKVLKTAINQPLSGTGEGKLGITLSATLSGSLEQSCEYKY